MTETKDIFGTRSIELERELLKLEIDIIFGLDNVRESPVATLRCRDLHALIIWSSKACFAAADLSLSTELQQQLKDDLEAEQFQPSSPPVALSRLADRLGVHHNGHITGGPTYLMHGTSRPPQLLNSGQTLKIVTSADKSVTDSIKSLERPSTWEADEWTKLLDGELGPWAMALHSNTGSFDSNDPASCEVAATCFSARRSPEAAEAGLWTAEKHRGRRIAPSVAAAWAGVAQAESRVLFYSTSSDNVASQSVARYLELEPLGWIWKLHVK